MTKVFSVVIQIKAPGRHGFPGRTVEGAYIVENGSVILTDYEGKPALDDRGYRYTHKLAEGENAETIAGRLTRELREALRGRDAPVRGFDEPIEYFNRGKI